MCGLLVISRFPVNTTLSLTTLKNLPSDPLSSPLEFLDKGVCGVGMGGGGGRVPGSDWWLGLGVLRVAWAVWAEGGCSSCEGVSAVWLLN